MPSLRPRGAPRRRGQTSPERSTRARGGGAGGRRTGGAQGAGLERQLAQACRQACRRARGQVPEHRRQERRRRPYPAARQALPEVFDPFPDPVADGGLRDPELGGDGRVGFAAQEAVDHRDPQLPGEPGDGLVEERQDLLALAARPGDRSGRGGGPFPLAPPPLALLQVERPAERDGVEPRRER
jgi:hypothetical protein